MFALVPRFAHLYGLKKLGHHQEQKTRRSDRVWVACVALGTWARAWGAGCLRHYGKRCLQIKRRIRRWPVLGRWWCAVLRLPLGLHGAALAGDVVGRQHGVRGQV